MFHGGEGSAPGPVAATARDNASPRRGQCASATVGDVSERQQPGGAPPLVIANPAARRGRAGVGLATMLSSLRSGLGPLDWRTTEHPGHAEALAAEAAAELRPLVISIGGDGTLSEVVNGLLRRTRGGAAAPDGPATTDPRTGGPTAGMPPPSNPPPAAELPRLGIVSTGTGGDFGRSLGLERSFDACLAALVRGRARAIDVGRARFASAAGATGERFWVNVLSAGIGGLVDIYSAAAPSWLGGRIAYGAAALTGIVTCPRVSLLCRSILPDGRTDERTMHAHTVAVCNGHTFGGGMSIAPMARVDDGLLEVVSFETKTKLQLIRRLGTVYRGTHVLEPGVNHFTCRSLELSPLAVDGHPLPWSGRRSLKHGLFPLDLDGDARGDVPVSIDLLPGALLVLA
jgi:diacylglycerol kinase (ATP)